MDGDQPVGFRVGEGLRINHLQFSDDTLLLCEKDANHLERLGGILEIFLAISGLKFNYSKSQLLGCNIEAEEMVQLANILDVESGPFLFNILGLPLGKTLEGRNFGWL